MKSLFLFFIFLCFSVNALIAKAPSEIAIRNFANGTALTGLGYRLTGFNRRDTTKELHRILAVNSSKGHRISNFTATTVTLDGTSGSNSISTSYSTTGDLELKLGFFVDYLIVGGGGGGGGNKGGGGGGGQVKSGTIEVAASTYSVSVGGGGSAGSTTGAGSNGTASSVFGITATFGNGGSAASSNGGTSGDGYSGGNGTGGNFFTGGGGGGAGQAGSHGTSSSGGNGGEGQASSITGSSLYYGGGGGGGSSTSYGSTGGAGGGGDGAASTFTGKPGSSNRGGGGGGGGNVLAGGAGGSGVVVIRYAGASLGELGGTTATSFIGDGTIGLNGVNYRVHTFNSGGNFNLSGLSPASRLGAVLSGNITGTGSLTYSGPGFLTLTGTNSSYTGATSITSGILNIRHASALGTTDNGTTVSSGAALELQGGITVGAEALTINNTGISSGGALRNISGDNTWGGTVTLSTNATRINSDAGTLTLNASNAITASNINLTIGGAGNTTVSGTITTGTGTLTKDGNGKVVLSGTNSYTGATTVSAGVLNIQNAQGTGTTAGGVTVASGAALELQGGIIVGSEALTINNTGVSSSGALRNISGDNTWGGTVTLSTNATRINSDAGTLTLNASNAITASNINLTIGGAGNTTVSGTITTGTGTLTKDGNGTLTLTGANTYTGATTISAGTLVLNNSGGTTIPVTNNVTVSGGILRISSNQALNDLTVSGGTLIVDNGVTLTVNGTFTGGGTVQNDGSMIIKGATFPGSTTTISSMTNLEINRSTGVTLDKSMTVSGTLTLTSGKLSLGSVNLTVSGSISGATSTKYISTTGAGTLKRNITNNGSFVFPVGNSSYNPITITNKTGSADDFSVKVIDEVYANGSSGALVTTTNRVKRTWDITKAAANGGSGVDLLLNWTPGTDVNGTISIPKLYHYESPAWAKKSTTVNTTYDVAAGTLTFTGYTGSFSPFSIMDDGAALPVSWLSFTGRRVHGAVELNWSTASEQNNSHFEVERSINAVAFNRLGRVNAGVNPGVKNDYQYLDQSPIPGRLFYRLKQVDLDGKFSYSSIIQINGEIATGISTWVIPGANKLTVVIPQSLQGVSELSIYDATGRTLQRQKILPGRSEINLNGVTGEGVYFIKLIKGNAILYTSQFIK